MPAMKTPEDTEIIEIRVGKMQEAILRSDRLALLFYVEEDLKFMSVVSQLMFIAQRLRL
jgi:hypothetical protein